MRTAPAIFGRTPGARPAVVGGLINGVAIGTPLLVGAASGEPAAGALTCIGAYIAAFTNEGGQRWSRTTGLVMASIVNTAAFAVGAVAPRLFPLDVAVFAALVFIASMGAVFGATVARCGTMPPTAFLSGVYLTEHESVAASVLLFAVGGLWYAVATMALTPAPRLRSLMATIGAAYSNVAVSVADETKGLTTNRSQVETALREADNAVLVLAGPGGDDAVARVARTLVDGAAGLVDAIATLRSAGQPDPAIAQEYRALGESLQARLNTIAAELTGGKCRVPRPSDLALDDFIHACNRMRQAAIDGEAGYSRATVVGQLRRRMLAISAAVDSASAQVEGLSGRPNLRLPGPGASQGAKFTMHGLRSTMRLTSTTYRHALRATVITAGLLALVTIAHLPHGEWAALAALRVLRPQYGATSQRAWQRVIGNVVGGTCAAVAIAWIQSPTALAALLFVIITVGFALRPVNYAFWVLFGTPLILVIGDFTDPGDWHAAVGRIAMTMVGTTAAVIGYFLLVPDWDINRLPGQLARAAATTADYLDAVLVLVADPTAENRAAVDAARGTATASLRGAEETLAQARNEPGRARIVSAATVLNELSTITSRLAALTSLPADRSSPIPHLDQYRQHAVAAIRNSPGPSDAVPDAVAVETAVDGMGQYLHDLHVQRETELRAQPEADTPLRAAVRENQPVIEELGHIAETIALLANAVTADGSRGIR
jgi:uncharacterized membrane protein YccC